MIPILSSFPQDLSALEHIPELIDAGVSCLKIEGRLKARSAFPLIWTLQTAPSTICTLSSHCLLPTVTDNRRGRSTWP